MERLRLASRASSSSPSPPTAGGAGQLRRATRGLDDLGARRPLHRGHVAPTAVADELDLVQAGFEAQRIRECPPDAPPPLTLTRLRLVQRPETIDFDQLSDTGLFLLHGPTGAGKTTILDAVSFALFGTVPGVRPAGQALRSHHAVPATPTEVELEVTLDGRRYRIVRRPKQQRPKQRGEGTAKHPSYATVQELVAGAWVVRASKPNEADPYLQDHLHMEADQFHQIVMLPQGDFARFLRASADERRAVLEELFGTHRFTEVERWLRAQADADRAAVRDADDGVRHALVAAATVADVDPFGKDEPLTGAMRWLTEVTVTTADRGLVAAAAEEAARATHREARGALADAVQVAERQQRLAAARVTRARLDESADAHAADRARRESAMRAAPVRPLIDQLNQAGAILQAHTDSVATGRAALAVELPELVRADRERLGDHDELLVGTLSQVTALLADERRLAERDHELDELAAQLDQLDQQLLQLEGERSEIPRQRTDVGAQLDDARRRAARHDDLGEQLLSLTARHRAAVERDRLELDGATCRAERDAAGRTELDAQQAWLELFEAQLSGRAAALAEALADGHPCPVCGSADHPSPATGDGSLVGDDDVSSAKQRFDQAAEAATRADKTLRQLEKRLAAAAAIAGKDTAAELADAVADHSRLHAEAAEAAAHVPTLEALAEGLEQRAEVIDEEMRAAQRERRGVDRRRSKLEGAVASDRDRVERARADFASLSERADVLQAHRALIATLMTALDQQAQADEAVVQAMERADREAVENGFADVLEAGAAGLNPADLAELGTAIDAHERTLTEVSAELRHPDLVAAAALPAIDLDGAKLTEAAADRDLELASISADATRKATERLSRIQVDVERQLAELGPKLETYERSRRLADLATGDDRQVPHRMRLSTYVLAARLEQVAIAASERLQRMSNGRYTIVHTDEAPDGRRKGGLGLRIVDAWTSTERETSTLSGVRASSRPWPWPLAWRTSSAPRTAAWPWKPCSSMRGSAASTTTPSKTSWTSSTVSAPAAGPSAS